MPEQTVSKSSLSALGFKARDKHSILDAGMEFDGHNVRGCCIEITNTIIGLLMKRYLPRHAVEQWRCGIKDSTSVHYVAAVKSKHVEDVPVETGYVIVDASIDQFCDEQGDLVELSLGPSATLPEIGIYPPDAKERREWYRDYEADYDPTSPFTGTDIKNNTYA